MAWPRCMSHSSLSRFRMSHVSEWGCCCLTLSPIEPNCSCRMWPFKWFTLLYKTKISCLLYWKFVLSNWPKCVFFVKSLNLKLLWFSLLSFSLFLLSFLPSFLPEDQVHRHLFSGKKSYWEFLWSWKGNKIFMGKKADKLMDPEPRTLTFPHISKRVPWYDLTQIL